MKMLLNKQIINKETGIHPFALFKNENLGL
jgi:hypothetical protein